MKKSSIVYLIIIIVLLGLIIFLGMKIKITSDKYENNKRIYCLAEFDDITKTEFYVDFNDGIASKYTQVFTNKLDDATGLETYRNAVLNENLKFKGVTAKVWNDDKIRVTTEIFNLDELTEEEMHDLNSMSIKEFKSMSRQEIIDAFTKDNEKLKCN